MQLLPQMKPLGPTARPHLGACCCAAPRGGRQGPASLGGPDDNTLPHFPTSLAVVQLGRRRLLPLLR